MAEGYTQSSVTYTICATVPTGLEAGALEECKEVFGRNIRTSRSRGKIFFDLASKESVRKLAKLYSVDKYSVLVADLKNLLVSDESKENTLKMFESLPYKLAWKSALDAWMAYTGKTWSSSQVQNVTQHQTNTTSLEINGTLQNQTAIETQDVSEPLQPVCLSGKVAKLSVMCTSVLLSSEKKKLTVEEDRTTFRVTCTRTGTKHTISSMEAAKHFGSGVNRLFGWKVKLVNPDIEVLLSITDSDCLIAISLTQDSRHLRNISHFGPTTLRSTIAYGLVRLAKPEPGEIVIDPMCGGGSISIEAAIGWPLCYHLAGDNHDLATPRTLANVVDVNKQRREQGSAQINVDVIHWDVTQLPLRTHSIDAVVTDLPFGKKSGNKVDNWKLYPAALKELGRVCKPLTGRAVLLTYDTKVMTHVLSIDCQWKKKWTYWVNVGGLKTAVYILSRTKT